MADEFTREEIWCKNCEMLWCSLYYLQDFATEGESHCPFCGADTEYTLRLSAVGTMYAMLNQQFRKWLEQKHDTQLESAAKELGIELNQNKNKQDRRSEVRKAFMDQVGYAIEGEVNLSNKEHAERYREIHHGCKLQVMQREEELYGDYRVQEYIFPNENPNL